MKDDIKSRLADIAVRGEVRVQNRSSLLICAISLQQFVAASCHVAAATFATGVNMGIARRLARNAYAHASLRTLSVRRAQRRLATVSTHRRFVICLPYLKSGGAERVAANLAHAFSHLYGPDSVAVLGGIGELISEDTGWPVEIHYDTGEYAYRLRAVFLSPAEAARRAVALSQLIDTRNRLEVFCSAVKAEQERKQEWSARTEAEREAAKIDWKELTIAAAFLVVGVVAHILITPPTPDRVPSDKDVVVPLTKEQERRAQPKETFQECSYCPEMVVVPAGSFMMGSPPSEEGRDDAEGPQRRVEIGRFAVGKFEVTFDEWDACFKDASCTSNPNPRDNNWGRGRRPVINVSWEDITREYLPWLTRKTGKTYRLLTEAEWEYAARAGTTTRYAFGDTISESQAQYGASKTAAVGSFAANKFGLHDLHGNVWEWVEDNWHWKYEEMKCEAKYGRCWPAPPPPVDGSVWSGGVLSTRVARGGSWNNNARVLRSAFRSGVSSHRNSYIGFRVARTLD